MDEKQPLRPQDYPEAKKLRGLYRHVKISVKALDIIIVAGIAAIILCIAFGVQHSGYTVTFNSMGGTDVPRQELSYGDFIAEPEAPTREGYRFTGWYSDEALTTLWDFDHATVEKSMELYAGWSANQ